MSADRPATPPFEKPGHAVAEQGLVLLDGPDGIAISLTPDAAQKTGESLVEAATSARRQLGATDT